MFFLDLLEEVIDFDSILMWNLSSGIPLSFFFPVLIYLRKGALDTVPLIISCRL